jgi:hypothetical protein
VKKLTARDTSRLASVQLDAMNDLCNISHIARSSGTYSTQGTETRTTISNIPCGIDFTNGQVRQGGQVLVVDYDAILRISATQTVLPSDEIQLLEKGTFTISGTFKPHSQPTVNSGVQLVPIKRVAS